LLVTLACKSNEYTAMKKQVIKMFVFVALTLVAMNACDKDRSLLEPEQTDDKTLASYTSLVEIANQKYLSVEVDMGSIDGAFVVPNDGLIDEYTATEKDFETVDKQSGNSFLLCLRSTELDDDQKIRVRRILHNYRTRNEHIRLHYS
jgi:hypothetical protein